MENNNIVATVAEKAAATLKKPDNTIVFIDKVLKDGFIFSCIQNSLKGKIPVDSFIEDLKIAISQNLPLLTALQARDKEPKLFMSLFVSLLKCASDGLIPDGRDAFLNIYQTTDKETGKKIPHVTYIPMKYGLLKAAGRNKISLEVDIVYIDEPFSIGCNEMQQRTFNHEINVDGLRGFEMVDNKGVFTMDASKVFQQIKGAYAKAIDLKNRCYLKGEWMSISEILRIYNNKAIVKTKSIWNAHPLRMINKTLIHRICNEVPQILPDSYLVKELEDSELILNNPKLEAHLQQLVNDNIQSIAYTPAVDLPSMFTNKKSQEEKLAVVELPRDMDDFEQSLNDIVEPNNE